MTAGSIGEAGAGLPRDPTPGVQATQRASVTVRRLAQTRRELVGAAARLFVERGYDATTVADIADSAGISPRTFFRYFAAKDEILNDFLQEGVALFSATLEGRPASEPLLDSLRAAGRVALANAMEQGAPELITIMKQTPALRAQWLVRCNTYTERIAVSLGRRLDTTEVPMVADLAAGALMGMVISVVDRVPEMPAEDLTRSLDQSFTCFVSGFGGYARGVSSPAARAHSGTTPQRARIGSAGLTSGAEHPSR